MYIASSYEEIENNERNIENKEIVIFLFARPTESDILSEFEYLHFNSGKYCSIYAIGYTTNPNRNGNHLLKSVDVNINGIWYFNTADFVDFKNKLEARIKWRYSGETEVLILQNNPGQSNSLSFNNYVAIDINKGIREGYIDSFQSFMESIIRNSKSITEVEPLMRSVQKDHFTIKDIISSSINECKKVPESVKKIIKDRLFYKPAKSIL